MCHRAAISDFRFLPPPPDESHNSGLQSINKDASTDLQTALAFESASEFTLQASTKGWNGTLYYSTNLDDWQEWDGSEISSADGKLYLRGENNTKIAGDGNWDNWTYSWRISGSDGIACSGNIMNLLDHATVTAGNHPTMAEGCFAGLFYECSLLTSAPELPATTLSASCYRAMFNGCTSLTALPELPATTLAENCYNEMFWGCSELTTPPALPATTLANGCYQSMFNGCSSLATAPALPATTLADNCYLGMFSGCKSLTTPPALPATTLASFCYWDMFNGCSSLATAPALPATTLANVCYAGMFKGCTALTAAPELPATTLANDCYAYMFRGCTGIKVSDTKVNAYSIEWRIPNAGEISSSDVWSWNWDMLANTGGLFTGDPSANTTYYLWDPDYVKPAPGELTADNAVAFESNADFTLAANQKGWNGYLFHSTDLKTWTEWDGSAISSTNGRLYVCGEGNTKVGGGYGCRWISTGEAGIECSGNIENLLDYKTVANGEHPAMNSGCYMNLFNGCTKLTKAPELPATTLAEGCYKEMFWGCSKFTAPPALPATTLANNCYESMFNGCKSLATAPALPATTLASFCYNNMFGNCTGLTEAPALPATTLASYCYQDMFNGCKSLTTPPALPATTLANGCYAYMFSGCSNIKLSDTQIDAYSIEWRIPTTGSIDYTPDNWNGNMLSNTGGLFTGSPSANTTYYLWDPDYVKPAPGELTADNAVAFESNADFTLAANQKGWNGYLFHSTDLKTWTEWDGSAISSTNGRLYVCGEGNTKIAGGYAYRWISTGEAGIECSGNIENLLDYKTVAEGNHPTMAEGCFAGLFYECSLLTSAPELPATTLSASCYRAMFNGCTSLTALPELPATTLAENCYNEMFWGCSELTTPPALPATTLTKNCYNGMFNGCKSLTTPPALPATTLANNCYESMFNGCKSLATAPALPATTLASFCYWHMFNGCSSLATAPALPATTLANDCYAGMFKGCTALTAAPELPATTLASYCYQDMFNGCKSLTTPPALPATTLTKNCYNGMFNGCKSLTTPPALPATTLANGCYAYMFSGCSNIKLSDTQIDAYSIEWRIPTTGSIDYTPDNWNGNMLSNTGGTFTGNPDANATYYLWNPEYVKPVPGELTADNAVAFESNADFTLAANQKGWNGYLFHSTDLKTWTEWDGSAISSTNGRLYVCGEGNTKVGGDVDYKWILTGDESIDCSGDIMNLLDYKTVANGKHPAMNSGCYMNLFNGCTKLTKAPELPATTLANNCYDAMFSGCTSLTTLPELPATTLADYCYADMFYGCTSLTTLPELPAENLAWACYQEMFYGCTGLTSAPALPATTLAIYCYLRMFYGCTSLTTLPELPATTLAYYCYSDMFNGCTSLTTLPELPATTLANYCYSGMFNGCTGIKVSETRTDSYTLPWKAASLGSTEDLPEGWNNMMFEGTGGTFTGSPEANRDYYLYTGDETGITTSKATSISLRLYPNPAHNHVCITGLPEAATTIRIYDVAGRLVLTSTTDGSESQTIDVSGLAKGLHYVRIGAATTKLMIK